MSKKRDYTSAFRSDLVSIYVGPSKQKYTAHKDILTKVDYFAKCLRNFKESETMEINLPEDDPDVFEVLLEYTYHGRIQTMKFTDDSAHPGEDAYVILLIDAYINADKYCMEACQNHVMDCFFDYALVRLAMPFQVRRLSKLGYRNCNLRKFLLDELAFRMRSDGWRYAESNDKSLMGMITGGGDDAEDFFKACMDMRADHVGDDHPGVKCRWHTHITTEECVLDVD